MAISLKDLRQGQELKPPRGILYGVSGIGKTTFAAGAPAPVFIQTEDGQGELDLVRFPVARSYQEVIEALQSLLTEEHQYKTVVIDTIDLLEKLIFAKVVDDAGSGKKNIEDIGYGKGYTAALTYWAEVLHLLDRLRDERGMQHILLAHSLIKSYSAPDIESFDRYRFDMHDKSASAVRDWADYILFANYRVFTTKDGKAKARGIGHGERVLYTEERPAHWGKNRYSLPYELPFPKDGAYQIFENALLKRDVEPTE